MIKTKHGTSENSLGQFHTWPSVVEELKVNDIDVTIFVEATLIDCQLNKMKKQRKQK